MANKNITKKKKDEIIHEAKFEDKNLQRENIIKIVLAVLVLGEIYAIDVIMSIVSILAVREYTKCAKKKNINIISWLGYVASLLIAILHIFPPEFILIIIAILFPLVIFILFLLILL